MIPNSVPLLGVIGNTPLVTVPFPFPCQVAAKLEYLNPSGSIKDRSALYLVELAEKEGRLKPGGTIIEGSSGNQGIAVAMMGAIKGYKVIITVSDAMSSEKRHAIAAYGAEIVVCPSRTTINDPENYRNVAKSLHNSIPGSFMPNQYFNIDNTLGHYGWLGPEIWTQTEGQLTHFVAAAGTGGTLSGVARFLKEKNPDIVTIGVDVATSYRSTQGNPQPYVLEGIGVDFETPCLDHNVVDTFIPITDDEGLKAMAMMAKDYGFLIGTAGGAVAAALVHHILPPLPATARVVTVFTDSGRAYPDEKYRR